MAKNNNNLLLVAGIAAAGYWLYRRSAAPAPVLAVQPGVNTNTGILPPPAPAPQVQPPPNSFLGMNAPLIGTGSASTPMPSVANDARLTDIRQWISTLSPANAAQATKALSIMSQDEIAGLYDIVHNDFYGNGITTPAQRAFWNAWRVKYHVLDGTYN